MAALRSPPRPLFAALISLLSLLPATFSHSALLQLRLFSTLVNFCKAAKARIKPSKQLSALANSDVELTCEVAVARQAVPSAGASATSDAQSGQAFYWYFNGDLLNYLQASGARNFSLQADSAQRVSRLRLFNVQAANSGNYTCKPTGADSATTKLHVKSEFRAKPPLFCLQLLALSSASPHCSTSSPLTIEFCVQQRPQTAPTRTPSIQTHPNCSRAQSTRRRACKSTELTRSTITESSTCQASAKATPRPQLQAPLHRTSGMRQGIAQQLRLASRSRCFSEAREMHVD